MGASKFGSKALYMGEHMRTATHRASQPPALPRRAYPLPCGPYNYRTISTPQTQTRAGQDAPWNNTAGNTAHHPSPSTSSNPMWCCTRCTSGSPCDTSSQSPSPAPQSTPSCRTARTLGSCRRAPTAAVSPSPSALVRARSASPSRTAQVAPSLSCVAWCPASAPARLQRRGAWQRLWLWHPRCPRPTGPSSG